MNAYARVIIDVVKTHNGFAIKLLGDGAFIAFQDASEGICCAVDIQRTLLTSGKVQTRIGLHTGSAIQQDNDFYGVAVNIAARIASRADGGQILVSKETAQLAEPIAGISYQHLGSFQLKGIPDSISMVEVIWDGHIPRTVSHSIGVVVEQLHAVSLKTIADIAERFSSRLEEFSQLPVELTAALSHFDRIAQYIRQYLTLHSMYRRREVLGSARRELKALRQDFTAVEAWFAPDLLQVADEWLVLLEEENETRQALAEATREIPNLFVFGNPVAETEYNVFTGRRDIVRQIEESILGASQTPTLLLHGSRRMGKTSILNQLPRLLGPDFAPAIVDSQNPAVTSSAAALLRYLSRAISDGLRRRRVAVEPLTAAALEREPFTAFDEWLDGVERAMSGKMRTLLCLDEYERLQRTLDAGWGTSVLDLLRHTLQHRPRVLLMFTGAHTFAEVGPAWTDRFINARRVRVSFLKPDEVIPLLTKPIPQFDMTYAPGALEAIIVATNCQPFLTQAVAFELVQFLNEQRRKEATPDDVETAIARALVSGGEYFANVWNDAGEEGQRRVRGGSEEGQRILRAIAKGKMPPDFPVARTWLQEHDVLNGEGCSSATANRALR